MLPPGLLALGTQTGKWMSSHDEVIHGNPSPVCWPDKLLLAAAATTTARAEKALNMSQQVHTATVHQWHYGQRRSAGLLAAPRRRPLRRVPPNLGVVYHGTRRPYTPFPTLPEY